jgi:hypothetical protein
MATQLGQVPFSPCGLLPGLEKQSRTRGSESGGVADQPQHRRLWRRRTPNARSLSRSPSSPPPSFTESPSPPRSLVRDGQTSPHRPRLVVSRSTCPSLSPSPHANSFVIGTVNLPGCTGLRPEHHPRPHQNGMLTHSQDPTSPLRIAAQRKVNAYRQQSADNQSISFIPAVVSTSTESHGECLRLLFLQAHLGLSAPRRRPRRT